MGRLLTLVLLFSAVAAGALSAQTGMVRGRVTEAGSNAPLAGAAIEIEGSRAGASCDDGGSFVITGLGAGTHTVVISYVGYRTVRRQVAVGGNGVARVDVALAPEAIAVEAVTVVGRANRESEATLLREQKEALVVVRTVGALEMSRKGVGNAQTAVAQVAGVSKQEGVKNVFVRGLGDRYNATLLNGFPVPSEDPEYKNIALGFFGSDIIRNIAVSKVFSAETNGDVGGAVIDISSKELVGDRAFSADVEAGVNGEAMAADRFLKQDGVGFPGVSNTARPAAGSFDFANSLDPSVVAAPLDYSVGLSGGRRFGLGGGGTPLSFFVVASHATGHSFTDETVRNTTGDGTVVQEQKGRRSGIEINQLVLANVDLRPAARHSVTYNFMMLHANDQYVAEMNGFYHEKHQDSPTSTGFMRRQQSNDNLLLTNQLTTRWALGGRMRLDVGAAYNSIGGREPDRRENYLSLQQGGIYNITGSNSQRRFFSDLRENDLNLKAVVRYALGRKLEPEQSNVAAGYRGRMVDNRFEAVEYSLGAMSDRIVLDGLRFDDHYNAAAFAAGAFGVDKGRESTYAVSKYIHSAYAEVTHRLTPRLAANIGFQVDLVDMKIDYHVLHLSRPGSRRIERVYALPSVNLRYGLGADHSLRLGASKSYVLPQAKEISPYKYVNIGFASQGNPDLKPSDCYNVDLKWDWYAGRPSELVSLGVFWKHIVNPIGRVDEGNSAGLLSYDNISPHATVAGVELEVRKDLLLRGNERRMGKLTAGVNASYIHSDMTLRVLNTRERKSRLEGASPFIMNGDLSWNAVAGERSLTLSLVGSCFSRRIHTLGSQLFDDIMEEPVVTLGVVGALKVDRRVTLKMKAANLLDPSYRLTRTVRPTGEKITLGDYRKGMDFSVGISIN
jgi:hypothetical protein